MSEVHVAVAVVQDSAGGILIAKRPQHLHQGGLWEFPGGKVEVGENIKQALIRELKEEINITIVPDRPLIEICHDYGDKQVFLDVWLCQINNMQRYGAGSLKRGSEGQLIRWVPQSQLSEYKFPNANHAIIRALKLPDKYLITPELHEESSFISAIEQVLQRGVRLIQFRDSVLKDEHYIEVASRLTAMCQGVGARLMVKGIDRFSQIEGVAGIHLSSHELRSFSRSEKQRADLEGNGESLIAASCHNVEEIQIAQDIGADFITLSPVLETASHSGARAIGWKAFHHLCRKATMPVFALGGLKGEDQSKAWQAGAQGIAAIRGLWP